MYAIKSNIPIPPMSGRQRVYPFAQMEVDQCFDMPIDSESGNPAEKVLSRANVARSKYQRTKQGIGKEFTVRTIDEEMVVRVWRIKRITNHEQ